MHLVFWLNSTFLHCSYLILFTRQFFEYQCFHCLPSIKDVSRETKENSCTFFFFLFFFLEGGEVTGAGGRKRRIKMVDGWKKELLCWVKICFISSTLVFGSRVDLCRCNFNSSASYTSVFSVSINEQSNLVQKTGSWANSSGICCLTIW